MTPKQEQFCREYLIDLNASAAARRAGVDLIDPANGTERCYVYLLIDPRNQEIFYVGKGVKKRVFTHERLAARGKHDNKRLALRIISIQTDGFEVTKRVFKDGLRGSEALILERQVIRSIGIKRLTNNFAGYLMQWEKEKLGAESLLTRLIPFETWATMRHRTEQDIATYRRFEAAIIKLANPTEEEIELYKKLEGGIVFKPDTEKPTTPYGDRKNG